MIKEPFKGYFSAAYLAETMVEFVPRTLKDLNIEHLLEQGPFADFGCGIGTLLRVFEQRFPNLPLLGIDYSEKYLEEARKKVSRKVKLIKAFLEDMPLENDSVAIGFSHKIYQLCNEDSYPEIASEIFRVLQKGGVYFAIERMEDYNKPFLELGFTPAIKDPFWTIYLKNQQPN